jgi:hypothetical protein
MDRLGRLVDALRLVFGGHGRDATEEIGFALVVGVVATVAATLLAGRLLARLPADHFHRPPPRPEHPLLRTLWWIARNLGGAALLVVGLVMALPGVPGPGLATMFVGFLLLDFRGKRRLELKLLSRPSVLGAVNGLRARFRQPPLSLPDLDPPPAQAAADPHAESPEKGESPTTELPRGP